MSAETRREEELYIRIRVLMYAVAFLSLITAYCIGFSGGMHSTNAPEIRRELENITRELLAGNATVDVVTYRLFAKNAIVIVSSIVPLAGFLFALLTAYLSGEAQGAVALTEGLSLSEGLRESLLQPSAILSYISLALVAGESAALIYIYRKGRGGISLSLAILVLSLSLLLLASTLDAINLISARG